MDQNGKPRSPAPGIRSTTTYIIFLDLVLGQGATSKVFGGRHKKSGKRVACKVPHQPNMFRLGIDMEKESKVLLKLRHPNIVCLEAVEKDHISKETILIMELCTGGSLFDMLERPENSQGLQEEDFLQVLGDITCGVKYLRDNGYVHRDVKPGNIMCYQDENGRTIYKLADFGAARQLQDDEIFTSLHGTEEYLHPNIFERAVLRRPVAAPFDARVDLWSIGATLYHIATGSLPFRPQGGRKNSAMMFYLTTKKASGVISGVQTGPGERDVIWYTELPETCQLSGGLKKLVTELLAGLLEYDPVKVWSFANFFKESQSITNRKRLDVFWVCQSSFIKVHANPTDTFAEFQDNIATQTKLPANMQTFLMNGNIFQPDGALTVAQYPATSATNPIMLCSNEEIPLPCQIFPPCVAIMPHLHPRFSTQNDHPIAKGAVTVGHSLQRRQKQLHDMQVLFDSFYQAKRALLSKSVLILQYHSQGIKGRTANLKREVEQMRQIIPLSMRKNQIGSASAQGTSGAGNLLLQLYHLLGEKLTQLQEHERQQTEVDSILDSLRFDLDASDGLCSLWAPVEQCRADNHACATELRYVTSEMKEILIRFTRDKKAGKLSYNDEQIHKMEKLHLGELMKKTEQCIKRCEDRWKERHHKCMTWYNEAHVSSRKIASADRLVSTLIRNYEPLSEEVTDLTSRCWQVVDSQLSAPSMEGGFTQQPPREILLSTSTQTSLPEMEAPISLTPLTNGMAQHSGSVLTSPSKQRWGMYEASFAASAPSCRLSQAGAGAGPARFFQSSPAMLVAHGCPNRGPDVISEMKDKEQTPAGARSRREGARPTLAGDDGWQGSGSRLIRVPKELKRSLEEYRKHSGEFDESLQKGQVLISQLQMMKVLEAPELPELGEESSLNTLTLNGDTDDKQEDNCDSILDGLDIKRPPQSFTYSAE